MENALINGDCLEVMKTIEDNSIDCIITDPPYGIDIWKKDNTIGSANICKTTKYKVFEDKKNNKPNKEHFDNMDRVSNNLIVFGGNYFVEYLKNSSCWLVWDKINSGNFADAELIYTSFNTAIRRYKWKWNGMLQQDMKNKEKRLHPTQKPVGLLQKIILDYTKENDLILDCYSGSGSVAVACIKTNRRFIAIEKDKYYCDIANERILKEISQQDMLRTVDYNNYKSILF